MSIVNNYGKIVMYTTIEMNRVYEFVCEATFETLPQERVDKLFRDGRVASKFMEQMLEIWFPGLVFKDGKGYDHIHKSWPGQWFDEKTFTKGGAKFSPSIMQGGGRNVDKKLLWEHAMKMIYIFCDVVDFPEVQVVFKYGEDLTRYPNGNIPFNDRNTLFSKSISTF